MLGLTPALSKREGDIGNVVYFIFQSPKSRGMFGLVFSCILRPGLGEVAFPMCRDRLFLAMTPVFLGTKLRWIFHFSKSNFYDSAFLVV